MKPLNDITDREALFDLLLLGEILTRRGELGPLARLWKPAPKPRDASQAGRAQPTPAKKAD